MRRTEATGCDEILECHAHLETDVEFESMLRGEMSLAQFSLSTMAGADEGHNDRGRGSIYDI